MNVTLPLGARGRVFKLLKADLTAHEGYDWSQQGRVHRFSGEGPLCGPGHAHVYASAPLALWLRSLHVDHSYTRLVPGIGVVSGTDGLKLGVRELTLDLAHEVVIPPERLLRTPLVTAAIGASLAVYDDTSYVAWAEGWLAGRDRSRPSAAAAARAAAEAAWAAEASAWAAEAAAWAAEAAARAAAWAAAASGAAVAWAAARAAAAALAAARAAEAALAAAGREEAVARAARAARMSRAAEAATRKARAEEAALVAWVAGAAWSASTAKTGAALDLDAIADAAHIL